MFLGFASRRPGRRRGSGTQFGAETAILDTGANVDAWTDATHAPVWVHVDDPPAGIDPADFLAQRRLHGGVGALLWAARSRPDLAHAAARAARGWYAARGVPGRGSAPTLAQQAQLRVWRRVVAKLCTLRRLNLLTY